MRCRAVATHSQAHFVAESGISRAVQTINAIGCVNYQNEIVNNWSTMWGNGSKTFDPAQTSLRSGRNGAGPPSGRSFSWRRIEVMG